MRRVFVLLITLGLVLLGATAAAAETTDSECYPLDDCGEEGGEEATTSVPVTTAGSTDTTTGESEASGESGTLPITGGDVLGFAVIGTALVGAGALIVLGSRHRHAES